MRYVFPSFITFIYLNIYLVSSRLIDCVVRTSFAVQYINFCMFIVNFRFSTLYTPIQSFTFSLRAGFFLLITTMRLLFLDFFIRNFHIIVFLQFWIMFTGNVCVFSWSINVFYAFLMFLNEIFLKSAKMIGSGLATSGLIGAGVGVGVVFGSLLLSFVRNSKLQKELFGYAILGFALTEAIGLLAIMMAFLILFI